MKPTLLQRFLVRPGQLEETLRMVDPSLVSKAGGMENVMSQYLKGMYAFDKDYFKTGNRISRGISRIPFIGKHLAPGPPQLLVRGRRGRLVRGPNSSAEAVSSYVNAQKKHLLTVGDIITGRGQEGGYFARVGDNLLDALEGRKQFSFSFGLKRSRAKAEMFYRSQRELTDIVSKSVGKEIAHAATTQDTLSLHNLLMGRRQTMARMIKAGAWATIGVDLAAMIGTWAYRQTNTTLSRTAATIGAARRMDFGGGSVIQNSTMATERQRAVEAISNAQMNARYLLGAEAQQYH